MNAEERTALDEIRDAMKGDWRLQSVPTFTHGTAVQVFVKPRGSRAFKKAGPLLFPPDGGTVVDTLTMLGSMAVES